MSKEYILAIMNENTGMLVRDIEIEERLKIKVRSCDSVSGAEFVAVREKDKDFIESSLIDAKSTASAISDDESNYIPVIIECDVKVTTLDGEEIDRMQLVEEHREQTLALGVLAKLFS